MYLKNVPSQNKQCHHFLQSPVRNGITLDQKYWRHEGDWGYLVTMWEKTGGHVCHVPTGQCSLSGPVVPQPGCPFESPGKTNNTFNVFEWCHFIQRHFFITLRRPWKNWTLVYIISLWSNWCLYMSFCRSSENCVQWGFQSYLILTKSRSQSEVPGLAAAAALRNLSEMHILRPHYRPAESETRRVEPSNLCLTSIPGDAERVQD